MLHLDFVWVCVEWTGLLALKNIIMGGANFSSAICIGSGGALPSSEGYYLRGSTPS